MKNFLSLLETTIKDQTNRLNSRMRITGKTLSLNTEVKENNNLYTLVLRSPTETASLVFPKVRKDKYNNLVLGDRTTRALCPFMVVLEGQPQSLSYEETIMAFMSLNLETLFPEQGKKNQIDKILWAFLQGRGILAVASCQRFLNLKLFNALPLSGTPMQDWAMNHRLMIFDPIFDTLRPEEKLNYQKRKNELLYPWSSIGISDGAAATKNYILQEDLKKYTAFGTNHHNPIRNLYSTLGMKGEESPVVISESAHRLEEQGIKRGGWNWMTVFLDLPLNFEDQILVSKRHAGKTITYNRTITLFGEEEVVPGDNLVKGRLLGINEDDSPVVFDIDCDHAKVIACENSEVPFDGQSQPVRLITLEVVYTLKEGFKITNQHGNKGIVILEDLGTVEDPIRGEVPIDVIVSARSVQKRKNFGQILEAFTTLIHGTDKTIVISDDAKVETNQIENSLVKKGYPKEGTCKVNTSWGEFNTICGWVHWGVTKTPEEQLWSSKEVWSTNQRGLRTKGNKISTIELKALTTLFGPKSRVVQEILSHQQGKEEVNEYLDCVRSMMGNYRENLPVVEANKFTYNPAGTGTFSTLQDIAGTVSDTTMYPKGCYLKLPFTLRVAFPDANDKNVSETIVSNNNAYEAIGDATRHFDFDRIMVPNSELRQPWKHPTGKFGTSDVSSKLNQIIEALDRLRLGEIKENQAAALVFKYIHYMSSSLAFKTGKISSYFTSVRYPWSSKATAVLGRNLQSNWVEIHADMAQNLKVKDGDYVLIERFPCLGFMSTRIQRVRVTADPECKYVIRVSGNSLVSMNLDFDGDVIYVMSFHTEGSKTELKENFHNPHPRIKEVIEELNNKKTPITRSMNLQEMEIKSFDALNAQEHAELNATSLSVKLWTGPVIAMCYNLMRIVERNISYEDREAHINVEVFLDKVGNSVFSQKHGSKSLREECMEAVCLAEPQALIDLGFPVKETKQLCNIIQKHAFQLGIRTPEALRKHYKAHVEEGKSNIVNLIVRKFHKNYFATRSNLHPISLLEHLESPPCDLVGFLIHRGMEKAEKKKTIE